MPVVLYGYEGQLRRSENWEQRRKFGPERDEVTKRYQHNVHLHTLYFLPDIIRPIKPKRCACIYKALVGKPKRK